MRANLFSLCLTAFVLAACLASTALCAKDIAGRQPSATAEANLLAVQSFMEININAVDVGQASSGNSRPVNITVNVTQGSDASFPRQSVCGLDRFDFQLDTIELPPNGYAARIMSVTPVQNNFMYAPAPCSYLISLIPVSDYLNQESPAKPSPAKPHSWTSGIYIFQLTWVKEGNEIARKSFSISIGEVGFPHQSSEISPLPAMNSRSSWHGIDPIDQLNPQPEPPRPLSF